MVLWGVSRISGGGFGVTLLGLAITFLNQVTVSNIICMFCLFLFGLVGLIKPYEPLGFATVFSTKFLKEQRALVTNRGWHSW